MFSFYHALKHSHYDEALVKNADGIDIRKGCNNIIIENITGFTEDDSGAITLLDWQLEKEFEVEGLSPDICDITVKNVATSAFCTNVRRQRRASRYSCGGSFRYL